MTPTRAPTPRPAVNPASWAGPLIACGLAVALAWPGAAWANKLAVVPLRAGAGAKAALAGSLSDVVVAEIISAEPHPDADKLRVCQVSTGSDTVQVVCGAPNARVGLKAPLAQVGAQLPDNFTIKRQFCDRLEMLVPADIKERNSIFHANVQPVTTALELLSERFHKSAFFVETENRRMFGLFRVSLVNHVQPILGIHRDVMCDLPVVSLRQLWPGL